MKDREEEMRIKLAENRELVVTEFLREYLLGPLREWEDKIQESLNFLEYVQGTGASVWLEGELDEVDRREINPEEKDWERAGITAQFLWEAADWDQREEWYQMAQRGEPLMEI